MDLKIFSIAVMSATLVCLPATARTLGDFKIAEKHVILESPSVSPTLKGEMGPLKYWSADFAVAFPTAFGDNDLTELYAALIDATGIDYTGGSMQIVRTPEDTQVTSLPGSKMCGRTLDVNSRTVTLTDDYIAWGTTTYIENGDGHSTTTERYINYYVPDNSLLTIDSIFTPEGKANVGEAIMGWIETQRPSIAKSLAESGKKINLTENFYVKENGGIEFVYGQGEIAPDVKSLTRVTIPAESLKDSLTPLGKILTKTND